MPLSPEEARTKVSDRLQDTYNDLVEYIDNEISDNYYSDTTKITINFNDEVHHILRNKIENAYTDSGWFIAQFSSNDTLNLQAKRDNDYD